MKLKNTLLLAIVLLSLSISGCDSEFIDKLKNKAGLSQEEDTPTKLQSTINKNDCNDEENKQLVLEMIQDEVVKQANINKEKFIIEPTYTMLTTQDKSEFKTVCNARIVYNYPKEIENKSSVKLDVDYMISKNELTDGGYIVALFKTNLNELIDFQTNYSTQKEDFLFEKLQIKKIYPLSTSNPNEVVLFSTFRDSLKLNDWNEDVQGITCRHDDVNDSTQCFYRFTKKSYSVTVSTRRKDECFFCSKKPEFINSTHIEEIKI